MWACASPFNQLANQNHLFNCHNYNNTSDECCCDENEPQIPFLVINAERDLLLIQDAQDFFAMLKEKHYLCQYFVIPNVNHLSIILSFGRTSGSETGSVEHKCLKFINNNLGHE